MGGWFGGEFSYGIFSLLFMGKAWVDVQRLCDVGDLLIQEGSDV